MKDVNKLQIDRVQAVLALSRVAMSMGWDTGIIEDAENGQSVVVIDLPQGQVSWVVPFDSRLDVFPKYGGIWTGQRGSEQHDRMESFIFDV